MLRNVAAGGVRRGRRAQSRRRGRAPEESNDWLIDREAQRSNHIYSGIDHVGLQDQAVTESMDGITDHSKVHIGHGDLMIARTRRRALQAARAFAAGTPAPGVVEPEVMSARSGYFEMPAAVEWQQAHAEKMRSAERVLKKPTAAVEEAVHAR
jgi:hypothetical protein